MQFLWSHWAILSVSTKWLWYWKLSVSVTSNIMTLPIKTIMLGFTGKFLTYIITSITARPIWLAAHAIPLIMSVLTFKLTLFYIYLTIYNTPDLDWKKDEFIMFMKAMKSIFEWKAFFFFIIDNKYTLW